jgi:hypothetical protein
LRSSFLSACALSARVLSAAASDDLLSVLGPIADEELLADPRLADS